MSQAPQALVVGAGPVGLMAASELTRHGLAVRIVDKAIQPSPWSKAVAVHARTLEIFDDIGVLEAALDRGRVVNGGSVWSGTKHIASVDFTNIDSPWAMVLVLPQYETERLLTEHLASQGVTVDRGTTLTDIEVTAEGVEVSVDHDGVSEHTSFEWLVACDGAHSTVRKVLGVGFEGDDIDAHFALGDIDARPDILVDGVPVS